MRTGGTVVTCPSLARRAPAPAELGACLRTAATSTAVRVRSLVAGDDPTAQLARFALAGALATVVQVVLFTALAPSGALLANVVSWAASTALANELHRRRTFHAGDRVGVLAAQLEGGGLSLVSLLATSAALAWLAGALPAAAVSTELLLVLGVTAAVGLLRFVALRWSFVVRRPRPA
jgi:putative flippase GtrA